MPAVPVLQCPLNIPPLHALLPCCCMESASAVSWHDLILSGHGLPDTLHFVSVRSMQESAYSPHFQRINWQWKPLLYRLHPSGSCTALCSKCLNPQESLFLHQSVLHTAAQSNHLYEGLNSSGYGLNYHPDGTPANPEYPNRHLLPLNSGIPAVFPSPS